MEAFLRQQCADMALAVLSVDTEMDGLGGERLLVRCSYDDGKDAEVVPDSLARERLEDRLRPALKRAGIEARPVVMFIADSEVEQEPADERCDYISVPPIGYDHEGYPVEDSAGQIQMHTEQRSDWYFALRHWCRRKGLGEVFADLPMFYRRGQRNKLVCPDLMVALRAERLEDRYGYKLWEEPTPEFALESLLNTTWCGDVGAKERLYQSIGVYEYWLLDAAGKQVKERLRGYRLSDRSASGGRATYRVVPKNRWGRRESHVLRLELYMREDELRFYDPSPGEFLLTVEEAMNRAREADEHRRRADQAAEQRVELEQAQREAAEKRIAELEAQLRALGESVCSHQPSRQHERHRIHRP